MPANGRAGSAETLPVSIAVFRKLVAGAKSEHARQQLAAAIDTEFVRTGKPRPGRRTGDPRAWKLYEGRMLEFLRRPALQRDAIVPLQESHRDAWQEMVHLRFERFTRLLEAFLRSDNRLLRAEAAQHLAWFGLERHVPLISRLLRGQDLRVASEAAWGAGLSALHGYSSPRFRARVFDAMIPLISDSHSLGKSRPAREFLGKIVEAMLRLDATRAMALFTGPRCLRPHNGATGSILETLRFEWGELPKRLARPIDPALLWPIFEGARGRHRETTAGLALEFAADLDPIRTRREARAIIKASRKEWDPLKDYARAALRRCRRVPEPGPALDWLERHRGKLNRDATNVLRAYELATHIRTDGLTLYFHNCGEHWKEALVGLRTLKLPKAGEALRKGGRAFGLKALAGDQRARAAAFENLRENRSAEYGRIEDLGEEMPDPIIAAVERYMSANAMAFRACYR